MEGYSVTEAASILGVPTERVWELLARGVLSGTPEGETGMRVYLQPRPAPAPPVAEPPRPNGDAEPTRELSPFRELLTEFRNLTERYGQALLALGEARGEVAALRSRVDLLEARMDLRLPMTAGPMTPPTPWPTPMPAHPTPGAAEEAAVPHAGGEERPDEDHADEDRRRRRRARRATESFAEALARAEDPTPSELPDAAETAAALAALREEPEASATEAVLPRELPAAEPMPLPDELEAEAGLAVQPEPVQVAPPEPVRVAAPQPDTERAVVAEPEPELVVEASLEPEVIPAAASTVDSHPEPAAVEPEAASTVASHPEPAALEPEAEADIGTSPERPPHEGESGMDAVAATVAEEPEHDGAAAEPIAWDPERYTVEIVEPDWYAEEPTAVGDQAAPDLAPQPTVAAAPAREPEPAREETTPEETMLWFGRTPPDAASQPSVPDGGADDMEVAGAQRRSGPAPLPGTQELDDALAALDALAPPIQAAPEQPGREEQPEARDDDDEDALPPAVGTEAPAAPPSLADDAAISHGAVGSLTSLTRPSGTSATRAYRRLRRIFPG